MVNIFKRFVYNNFIYNMIDLYIKEYLLTINFNYIKIKIYRV